MTETRIPWAWLGLAVFVVAGAGNPEVAKLFRWTFLLAIVYLVLTHYGQVDALASRFVGGLVA